MAIKKRQYTYNIRKRKKYSNDKKKALLLPSSINIIRFQQCRQRCLANISNDCLAKVRTLYVLKSQKERSTWLHTFQQNNQIRSGNEVVQRWHIDGYDVCKYCWSLVTTASVYKIQNCFKVQHGNEGQIRMTDRVQTALVWLTNFFDAVCEKMPSNNEMHIPCYLQWSDINAELNSYLASLDYTGITPSYLSRLHTKFFKHIKNPKYTRQGKCDKCLELKQTRLDATTEEQRITLQAELIKHNVEQMEERSLYKQRALQAVQQPSQYMSLIIDGMNSPSFPMHIPLPKGSARTERLKLHIHGIIDHGNKQRRFYSSLDHWKHGADFICTILHMYLTEMKEKISDDKWPHTLYLQVDNCWKENKNRTMFSFLGLLVLQGWFKEIYLYSLPTGHTHEDIDQMFSSWNVHYWKRGFQTPKEIETFLTWAYPTESLRPQLRIVGTTYQFKNWLSIYATSIKGHTNSRAFKFTAYEDNVAMFYKNCSLSQVWHGYDDLQNRGILLFLMLPTLTEVVPKHQIIPLKIGLIDTILTTQSIIKYIDLSNLLWLTSLKAG
jgi:hypothetical protein